MIFVMTDPLFRLAIDTFSMIEMKVDQIHPILLDGRKDGRNLRFTVLGDSRENVAFEVCHRSNRFSGTYRTITDVAVKEI